jgi:hypothetical protein
MGGDDGGSDKSRVKVIKSFHSKETKSALVPTIPVESVGGKGTTKVESGDVEGRLPSAGKGKDDVRVIRSLFSAVDDKPDIFRHSIGLHVPRPGIPVGAS